MQSERDLPKLRPSADIVPRNPAPRAGLPVKPSPAARPTPSVFDFATMVHSSPTGNPAEEERFATKEWLKEEDLRHPELYFELAESMPELNRPEERRDTLEFFLAYREKLKRELDGASRDPDKRQEILAALERYESAIARLRALVNFERRE